MTPPDATVQPLASVTTSTLLQQHQVPGDHAFDTGCPGRLRCALAAAIAQLVEHLICNQGVGGSSPSCGTIFLIIVIVCQKAISSEDREYPHFSPHEETGLSGVDGSGQGDRPARAGSAHLTTLAPSETCCNVVLAMFKQHGPGMDENRNRPIARDTDTTHAIIITPLLQGVSS